MAIIPICIALCQVLRARMTGFALTLEMLHPNSIFGGDRRAKVEARLREGYTLEQIKTAVLGCKMSPHNQGDNDTGTTYDDIELICRNSSSVERFINIHDNSGSQQSKKRESGTERKVRTLSEQGNYLARLLQSAGNPHVDEPPADALKLESTDFDSF
ncbi:MAG: hypothetical protein LC776_01590 [Acidobacteria bacterium]|nr:hypothetical protein [Acidobacteriota bacterium]